jgi:hypothetical protein
MSLEEADALRQDDRIEECDYRGASKCLVREEVAFGRKARVIAQINDHTKTIRQIIVEIKDFSRKKGYPCAAVADAVTKQVGATYGPPDCNVKDRRCQWALDDGVGITVWSFCLSSTPSSGIVGVVFSQDVAPPSNPPSTVHVEGE